MATSAVNAPVLPGNHSRAQTATGPSTGVTVRHLVTLKARLTWAMLTRSTAVIVGVVLGGLWGLGMLFFYGAVMVGVPQFLPPEGVQATAVLTASAGTLLWWVFAIVSGRADATLHASQFAMFPLPRLGIALGQIVGALVGIAGPLTAVALILHATMWRLDTVALVTALVLLPAGWLLMILGNRSFTAVAERVSAKRRVGEMITLVFLVLLMLTGPILTGLFTGVDSLGDRIYTIADVVAWTPVGALWAIPGDMAAGAYVLAALRAVIVLVTAGLLVWLWFNALRVSAESGAVATNVGSGKKIKGAGLFDRMPQRPWATVAARSLIYWVKDPRYSGSLVIVPVMFGLFWFMSREGGGMLLFGAPFVAFLMAYTISADVSYDHKGFALHVLTGVSGAADRLGRVIGMLLPGIPLTTLGLILAVSTTNRWDLLPGLAGVCALALLGGAGVSSVVSARYTYPVPLPGQSPFKTPQGFTVLNVLAQVVVVTMMALLTLPAVIPLFIQVQTGQMVWGVVALTVGVLLGAAVCAVGVWLGGKWLDARGPELLATVSNYR
ncbi:hypothetical protein [Kocuria sp.]|uniref:hypothetical protein n=1 Tax=Kocuria sp. TaxID=1871328 RepID=UPI0026DF7FD1|nr:hypothetical protein [Kocuria sp.]MDO5618367.1 hypothetical protein [Kocuria sp.]